MRAAAHALCGLVALLGGTAASAATVDRIAAVVNEDIITLTEVYALGGDFLETAAQGGPVARRQAELEVLETLIQRKLISQEISRLDLDVTEVELDRAIDDIASRNGLDRDQLRLEVERSGLPWSQYRDELRENLRQLKFSQAVVQPRITVNQDELMAAYKGLLRDVELPKVAELGAIFFSLSPEATEAGRAEVLSRAQAAADRVRAGEDFAAVSLELDEGVYGAQGGQMGTYRQGELISTIGDPAFALEAGQVTDPIVLPNGVFVITAFSIESEAAPSYDEMKDELFQEVYSGRIDEETEQWTRQARRRAAIQIKLESPDP